MSRMLATTFAALVAAAAVSAQSEQIVNPQETLAADQVVLRGLDTLNNTVRDLPLRAGETVTFGHLEITVDTCRVPRDTPEDDAYAYLRIRDIREAEPRFRGWMLASSPALSALDHPRYDVWVLSCRTR
jgi:hypothetical protein